MKYEIPLEYFESKLLYGRHTGCLVWRSGPYKGREVGCVVSNKAGNEYRFFTLSYKGKSCNFMAHQVIWFLCCGYWAQELDHENGNGLDNKLTNLRPVTRSINNKNHRKQSNNSSGLSGVSWIKNRSKWRAYTTHEDRQVILAYSADLFEVVCARKVWELNNGYTERHGK